MYIRTYLHTYITSTLVVHQHLLPRRTRRNHKAQKLTREAGGKIVSPTFRLPHCYRGETTKKASPRIENDACNAAPAFSSPTACTEFGTPTPPSPPHPPSALFLL